MQLNPLQEAAHDGIYAAIADVLFEHQRNPGEAKVIAMIGPPGTGKSTVAIQVIRSVIGEKARRQAGRNSSTFSASFGDAPKNKAQASREARFAAEEAEFDDLDSITVGFAEVA